MRPRWPAAPLSTALLLVLTVGFVYLALGPGRPGADRSPTLPALLAVQATPAPGGAAEATLLDVTLPADALPHGDPVSSGFAHFTIPPGTRSTWSADAGADYPGSRLEYVVEGTYAVRAEGAVQLLRAGGDGRPTAVPAGTEVVLEPGDALVSRAETAYEAANPGPEPVELLSWVLIAGIPMSAPGPGGGIGHDLDLQEAGLTVPPGAATLRLRRVNLAPDATLPAPPGGLLSAISLFGLSQGENAAGTPRAASIGVRSDGSIRNVGDATTLYVVTLEPVGGAGSPVAGSPTP